MNMVENIFPVAGIKLGVTESGIRYSNRKDLVVLELDEGVQTAAVFTRNAFCAAPVLVAKEHLKKKQPKYLLINTGNANAGTGEKGLEDCLACCDALAKTLLCETEEVLPFSTGVIGEDLPVDKITAGLKPAVNDLKEDNWQNAAEGILTTDTCSKLASKQISLGGKTVTVTGIAKGAGMIKPNMATMLAYIGTDASIAPDLLQRILNRAVSTSFNRITVDGDTSTNDACLLMATGKAGNSSIDNSSSEDYVVLSGAIEEVFVFLAQSIIRDAEGGTKFITIEVKNGNSEQECLLAAYAVAESPLVKTAMFASDPNWGRILAAVGRSGVEELDCNKVNIFLGSVQIVENGGKASSYTEEAGQAVMDESDITVTIDLARGAESATVWTSDLSHDYVKINAEYRT